VVTQRKVRREMKQTKKTSIWIADSCIACGSYSLVASPAILMPFVAERALNWGPVDIDESWNLSDVKIGRAYTRVNSMGCIACGTVFVDLRLGETQMARLYKDYRGDDYVSTRIKFEPHYQQKNISFNEPYKHIPKVEAKIKDWIGVPQSVLDWGGGDGLNTPFRHVVENLFCYDISGVELCEGVRKYCSETAPDVFDLVVCCQVLEHVSSPMEVLTEVKKFMSHSSFLYLDFPFEKLMQTDKECSEMLKCKRHWHEHINFFSEAGVREILKSAELDLVHLDVMEVGVDGSSAKIFQVLCKLP